MESQLPQEAYVNWVKYLLMAALASLGGAVSYLDRMGKDDIRFSLMQFTGELFASGFTGVIVYLLCDHWGIEIHLTAAIVGISGHMGSRALTLLERKFYTWLNRHKLDK